MSGVEFTPSPHSQEGKEHSGVHSAGEDTSSPNLIDLSSSGQDEGSPSLPPRPEVDATPVSPPSEHASEPHAAQEEEHPQVATLRGMFPDFEGAVILSVLESVDFDQDRAIDVLLGMSDPEYVATEGPAGHDLALDEQLARQLALEDQQQEAPRASGQSWPRRSDVPYQTRQHARSPQQQQQQSGYVTGNERDDFKEFQETLGRMAESGKRTFSSIVSKAKAKINEYNQPRSDQSTSPPANPQWGSAPSPQLDRHTVSEAYALQYYESDHDDIYTDDRRTPSSGSLSEGRQPQKEQLRGYDSGLGGSAPPSDPVSPTLRASSPPAVIERPSLSSPPPSGDIPKPPSTSSGSPINAAKLGLLPKRPVSLLTPQQKSTPQRLKDADELDYVENPFEEGRD